MREDDFRVLHPDDLTRVGLENELLSVEVEVLRAKLTNIDSMLAEKDEGILKRNRVISEKDSLIAKQNATIGERDGALAELRRRLEELSNRRQDQVIIDRDVYEELREARRDLVWTLNRLRKTPLVGPFIKQRSGFSRLAHKYLDD